MRIKKYLKPDELKTYIYQNHLIENVLNEIGCQCIKYHNSSTENYYTCTNPDNGDNPTAVKVFDNPYLPVKDWTRHNLSKNGKKPDILDLVQYGKHIKYFNDVVRYLHNILEINGNVDLSKIVTTEDTTENDIPVKPQEPKQTWLPESDLNQYYPIITKQWYLEGITREAGEKFDIRYSKTGKFIIIPIRHYKTGKLLAINKRVTEESEIELFGKYHLTKGYQKSQNIYGLYENRETIKKAGYVVVYEGEKSVLKRYSANDGTGVALSGHDISDTQIQILIDLDVDVIIAFDKDVDVDYVRLCCSKFYNNENFRKNHKIYYIHDMWALLSEKDSPADAGNDKFNYLLGNKIEYMG